MNEQRNATFNMNHSRVLGLGRFETSDDFNGIDLSSGVYFNRIQAGNLIDTKKDVVTEIT